MVQYFRTASRPCLRWSPKITVCGRPSRPESYFCRTGPLTGRGFRLFSVGFQIQIPPCQGTWPTCGTACLQSSNPEGLQENTYGPAGGRFDGKKTPKSLIICDLEQSDKIPDQAIVDPATVVENQSQKQAIVRPKAPVAGHQSQNKASVRFEGPLTTQKIVELYNLYTRQGSFKWCYKILAKKISGR